VIPPNTADFDYGREEKITDTLCQNIEQETKGDSDWADTKVFYDSFRGSGMDGACTIYSPGITVKDEYIKGFLRMTSCEDSRSRQWCTSQQEQVRQMFSEGKLQRTWCVGDQAFVQL
jgi:hypothetical protein